MTDIPCTQTPGPIHISYLRIRNYRALQDVELKNLQPVTMLIGDIGSGKSTVIDVFDFLSDCFDYNGLYGAWQKRGGGKELRTRDQEGPIVIELIYQEEPNQPSITYHIAIEEDVRENPIVAEEWLQWRPNSSSGRPFRFLEYKYGKGKVVEGERPNSQDKRINLPLSSPEFLAIDRLGQLTKYPRIVALRKFILSWHISCFSIDALRGLPEGGAQKRLTTTCDNLPNVLQYLKGQHPDQLKHIFKILKTWLPHIESIPIEPTPDGRMLLRIKEKFFKRPILSRFVSDGILKLLAILTLLRNPNAPQLVGMEQPEMFVPPHLLPELADECYDAAKRSQLFLTSHSPLFVNLFKSKECQFLSRSESGYTKAVRMTKLEHQK